MRTKATAGDTTAAGQVAQELWAAWEARCAGSRPATVAGLAELSKVKYETLRVFIRPAGGATRSGPGFLTVARVAVALGVDLTDLARRAVRAGGPA